MKNFTKSPNKILNVHFLQDIGAQSVQTLRSVGVFFLQINEIWSSISWIYMCTWSKFEKIHIVIQIEQNMDAEENVLN